MSSQAGPSSSGRAPRGAACLNCRRRKMRCDGARPICNQCIRTNRSFDCEYTDGPDLSPTQALEDQISRLEARIYELEHPETVPPPIVLHDPGVASQSTLPSPNSSGRVFSRASSPERGDAPPVSLANLLAQPVSTDPAVDLHPRVVQAIYGFFIRHARQVGFFLNANRFRESMFHPDTTERIARLSPALLNAVYLWGVRFSQDKALQAQEPVYLSRAVQAGSNVLAHYPPYSVVNTIQAEVLLAKYFFTTSRFLEGRYHCSAAVALALSYRLNKIRTLSDSVSRSDFVNTAAFDLPSPADAIDEGERINAFWTVFALDKGWSVALGSPSYIHEEDGAQIDTPWPLDWTCYEQGLLSPDVRGLQTVQTFIHDLPPLEPTTNGLSSLALRAKASALFERAMRLSSQYSPTLANADQIYAEIIRLDDLIDRFIASLLLPREAVDLEHARVLLVTHTLAHAATIQLHSKFRHPESPVETKDLAAARAAVNLITSINMAEMPFLDPILAILWTAVSRVLLGKISQLIHLATDSPLPQYDQAFSGPNAQDTEVLRARGEGLRVLIDTILHTMTLHKDLFPLMALQILMIQQEMERNA